MYKLSVLEEKVMPKGTRETRDLEKRIELSNAKLCVRPLAFYSGIYMPGEVFSSYRNTNLLNQK
ncbi:hypothetical protein EYF80_040738 [Liparis tanakae]|uniref:Uncharacterized protein n=1 Tax=Liparis tanakae TaxID=230148 RepID=A0A4Z2G6B6_9TELE|nr:hypothetical protein EYF80_040738 [Liparis tanakae]